jgi:hypothetical protein
LPKSTRVAIVVAQCLVTLTSTMHFSYYAICVMKDFLMKAL